MPEKNEIDPALLALLERLQAFSVNWSPEFCPTCHCPLCGERAHDYRCGA
jgi:hypothetical protein